MLERQGSKPGDNSLPGWIFEKNFNAKFMRNSLKHLKKRSLLQIDGQQIILKFEETCVQVDGLRQNIRVRVWFVSHTQLLLNNVNGRLLDPDIFTILIRVQALDSVPGHELRGGFCGSLCGDNVFLSNTLSLLCIQSSRPRPTCPLTEVTSVGRLSASSLTMDTRACRLCN